VCTEDLHLRISAQSSRLLALHCRVRMDLREGRMLASNWFKMLKLPQYLLSAGMPSCGVLFFNSVLRVRSTYNIL